MSGVVAISEPKRSKHAVRLDKDIDYRKIDVVKAWKMRQSIPPRTYQEIADEFGVSKQAVWDRLQVFRPVLDDPSKINLYREQKTNVLDGLEMYLDSLLLDPEKAKKATLGNVAYARKQINEINRLEKGLSTANLAYQDMTQAEREIEEQISKLRDGATIVLDSSPVSSTT